MDHADYQPLTVYLPRAGHDHLPIEVFDEDYSIRAAFVSRSSIEALDSRWRNSCGFYVLFSPVRFDGSFISYVGKATNGFLDRLRSHDAQKPWWTHAMLLYKDTVSGFNSTHAAYLEGRVRDIISAFPNSSIANKAPTGDKTIHEREKMSMESVADFATRLMAMRGYRNVPDFEQKKRAVDNQGANDSTPELRHSLAPHNHTLSVRHSPVAATEEATGRAPETESRNALYTSLTAWRTAKAKQIKKSPFVVFNNATLQEIAAARPNTLPDLLLVPGVGPNKIHLYGEELLEIVRSITGSL